VDKYFSILNAQTLYQKPHPVIYGGMLNNLSQIFCGTQRAKMTGFLLVNGL
jgi:hypothetical protein